MNSNPQYRGLTPWKKGQSGNPAGRKTIGAYQREYLNSFAHRGYGEKKLRRIFNRKTLPVAMRAAALRMLREIESPDLCDFAGLLRGENNLEDLRAMGIDTSIIKRLKQKTRKVPKVGGSQGEMEELVEREIELHDRSGTDFDRVTNHTDGNPTNRQETKVGVVLRTPDDRADEAGVLAARLRAALKPSGN